ncbi:MAG: hypothetical protein IJO70_01410 [Lachnospiraceae bacterium]|nr:hypothetical protein [Lachnospiraceae bacterium]
MKKKIIHDFLILLTGGIVYFYFEIFVRGFSHISMFLLGGVCFLLVGKAGNKLLNNENQLMIRMLMIMFISGMIITVLELITGFIVNVYLKLEVWDYSNINLNYKGQICLLYSLLWSLLGLPCVYFYGIIDKFILGNKDKIEEC